MGTLHVDDSSTDSSTRCRRYQEFVDQNDLESILEIAEDELFIEEMIRSGLKRAKSKPPKNENVARALSFFAGPSGEAEVRKLVAAVTNNMGALGEFDDEEVLRHNAEPEISDLITSWGSREEEIRAGLVKLFKFEPALLIERCKERCQEGN